MEMDIFKRKVEVRGYMFPRNSEGNVLFRILTLGNDEYTIESTTLLPKKPITVEVRRFVPDEKASDKRVFKEETVADAKCSTFEEVISFIDNITRLEHGEPVSPFDRILTEKGMTFLFKKRMWVRK
jgi:hypothetical protein